MWIDRPPLSLEMPVTLVHVPTDADHGDFVQQQTVALDGRYRACRKTKNQNPTVFPERPQGVCKAVTADGVNDNVNAAEGSYGLTESIDQNELVSARSNSNGTLLRRRSYGNDPAGAEGSCNLNRR